jgi:hypothetical protein
VSDDWLDKFRDDRQKPKPASKPQPKQDAPGWLERFRDDAREGAPRHEVPPERQPRNEPRRDRDPGRGPGSEPRSGPPAQPGSPPRGRPVPRNAPPPQGAVRQRSQDRPSQDRQPRPSGIPLQPQTSRGLWGRPRDILVFASLMALSLALGLSATALALPRLMEIASPLEILLPDFLVITVCGGFVYLVAGWRQSWAVWLLIAFCLVRFALYVPTFFHIDSVTVRMLTAMYFILQAAAFWFVFTPAAKRWLRAATKS